MRTNEFDDSLLYRLSHASFTWLSFVIAFVREWGQVTIKVGVQSLDAFYLILQILGSSPSFTGII